MSNNNSNNCIFCKIARKELDSKIIAENDYALAFLDIKPTSNGHVLIIPKKHFNFYSECENNYLIGMTLLSRDIAKKIALSPLKPEGFNFLINEGSIAGQEVQHLHMHVMPKYNKNEGFAISTRKSELLGLDKAFDSIKKSKYIIE